MIAEIMKAVNKDLDISEANQFLFAFAAILTPEAREEFYDRVQPARSNGDPYTIVETTWIHMVSMLHEEVAKRANVANEPLEQIEGSVEYGTPDGRIQ